MAQSKNRIENVAIVGAGGRSGKFIAEALLGTGKHVVTAITRADSSAQPPKGVRAKKIDYNDHSSIVEALRGQDALIITMGVTAPEGQESRLIRAAADADVPWVFPNEWGSDPTNEGLEKDLMFSSAKKATRDLIEKLGKSSWIGVSTGFWYEWSLGISVAFGFDFENREVTLFDDGDTRICTSTWPQVGRAVAGLLSLKMHSDGAEDDGPSLDRIKNGFVYVSSFTVSQNDMLDSVLRVTQTSREDWKLVKEPVHDRYAAGMAAMQKGDRMGFAKALYSRVFYPDDCGNTEKTRGLQNELLGLPKEDIDEYTKLAIQRSKEAPWS